MSNQFLSNDLLKEIFNMTFEESIERIFMMSSKEFKKKYSFTNKFLFENWKIDEKERMIIKDLIDSGIKLYFNKIKEGKQEQIRWILKLTMILQMNKKLLHGLWSIKKMKKFQMSSNHHSYLLITETSMMNTYFSVMIMVMKSINYLKLILPINYLLNIDFFENDSFFFLFIFLF